MLGWEWDIPSSLLSLHPSLPAVSIHQGMQLGVAAGPRESLLVPTSEDVGSDHPPGAFTEGKEITQEAP